MRYSRLLIPACIAFVVTIMAAVIYATVQHSHRSTANDPQLEIARDIRNSLENNREVNRWMQFDSIDLANSLSVFTVAYDQSGEPLRSNARLDGKLPRLPKGVFEFTQKNGEDVLTWQPRNGIRMAMVVEAVRSPGIAFVAAGRSLEIVEKREASLVTMVLLGWLACMFVIAVAAFLLSRQKPPGYAVG